MEIKRFERVFLLFTREDEMINGGQSPSGYVKLETLDNKIRLITSVQGLRHTSNDEFNLFLFSESRDEVKFFNAGTMTFKNSRCEIAKDILLDSSISNFEPFKNVGGAVIVKLNPTQGISGFSCPMVAYKNNKKVSYKSDLMKFLLEPQETRRDNEFENMNQMPVKHEVNIEVPMEASSTAYYEVPYYQEPYHHIPKQEVREAKAVQLYNTTESGLSDYTFLADAYLPGKFAVNTDINKSDETEVRKEINRVPEKIDSIDTGETTDFDEFQNMLRQFGLSGVESDDNNICMEPVTKAQKELCENCNKSSRGVNDKSIQINAAKLKLLFDKYFEPFEPFGIKRVDYRWWKIGSPVQLNNLLYQNNIKTPLLFNPQLMMAHFKYKHILAGIYVSRRYGKEYVVCGVPALYNIDEKPYGDFCRWAQLESVRPRHGAFGYWLVYIDIKTGNFLSL